MYLTAYDFYCNESEKSDEESWVAQSPSDTQYPTITITSPNGADDWQAGTTQNIQWSYTGDPGSDVRIFLLKDGIVDHVIRDETPIGSSGSGKSSLLNVKMRHDNLNFTIIL